MSRNNRISRRRPHAALAALGLVAALGLSSPASALVISGGTFSSSGIPVGAAANDLAFLFGLSSAGPIPGYFGANVTQTGSALFQYDFYGYEAGDANQFLVDGTLKFANVGTSPSIAANFATPLASFTSTSLGFSFWDTSYPGVTGEVFNGSNGTIQPDFFISQDGAGLILWFDDKGGGPDSDFDDMVVRISVLGDGELPPVPLPSSFPLFGGGLGLLGLLWLRRRKAEPIIFATS